MLDENEQRQLYDVDLPDDPYVRFERFFGGIDIRNIENMARAGTGDVSGLATDEELAQGLASKADQTWVQTLADRLIPLEQIDPDRFALKSVVTELESDFDQLDFRIEQLEMQPAVDLTPYAKRADVTSEINAKVASAIPAGLEGQVFSWDADGDPVAIDPQTVDIENYYTKSEADAAVDAKILDFSNGLPDGITAAEADAVYMRQDQNPDFGDTSGAIAGQSLILGPDGKWIPGGVPDNTDLTDYYTKSETDGEIADAVEAHESATDPHPQYTTQLDNDARYLGVNSLAGYATETFVDDSVASSEGRTQDQLDDRYTKSEANAQTAYQVQAHEAASDPHAQYLTETRGDARYLQGDDLAGYVKQIDLAPQLNTKQDKLVGDPGEYVRFDAEGNPTSAAIELPDLSDYATQEDLAAAIADIPPVDLSPYATNASVTAALNNKLDVKYIPDFGDFSSAPSGQVAKWDGTKLVPALDATGSPADFSNYYTKLESDANIEDAIEAHESATDPHSQYLLESDAADTYSTKAAFIALQQNIAVEMNTLAKQDEVDGIRADVDETQHTLEQHLNASDPHPNYLTQAEGDTRYLQEIPAEYLTEDEVYPDIEAKQDKLTGIQGQLVGFDANGNAIAQDSPDGVDLSNYATHANVDEAIDAHETATNPHPQYAMDTDVSNLSQSTTTALNSKLDASALNGMTFGDWTNAQNGQVGKWQNGSFIPATDDTGSPADFSNYYTKTQTDTEIADAFDAHNSAADPHSQYMTVEEGDFRYLTQAGNEDIVRADDLAAYDSDLRTDIAAEYETTADVDTKLSSKADTVHTHTIANVTGLQGSLDSKLDDSQIGETIASLVDGKVPAEQLPPEPDYTNVYASKVHSHAIADVTGLAGELDNKSDEDHIHVIADTTGLQAALDAKADDSDLANYAPLVNGLISDSVISDNISRVGHTHSEYAPVSHTHTISNVTGLQDALDAKASSTHVHSIANVTGLQAALDNKLDDSQIGVDIAPLISGKVPAGNIPDLSATYVLVSQLGSSVATLASGVVPDTQLPIGTSVAAQSHTHNYIPVSARGTASGVASLDTNTLIPVAQIPNLSSTYATQTNLTDGLATKSNTGHVHAIADVTNLSTTLATYIPLSQKAAASGVASLDSGTKIPIAQVPTGTTSTTVSLGNHSHATYVATTGNQTIAGVKTFSSAPISSVAAAAATELVRKQEMDAADATKANVTHTHAITDTTGLQTALNAKIDASTKGAAGGVASLDSNGFIPVAQIPDLDATYVKDSDLVTALNGKSNVGHTHAITDVTNLQTSLNAKLDATLRGAVNGVASLDANGLIPVSQIPDLDLVYVRDEDLQGVLDTKANVNHNHDDRYSLLGHTHATGAHTHEIADVNGLQTALDGKSAVGHSHAIADTVGLQSALDGKASTSHLHDDRYSLLGHNHDSSYVALSGDQTVAGIKTFSSPLVIPAPTVAANPVRNDDSRLSDARTPTAHVHTIAQVTNLQSSLDAKIDSSLIAAASGLATLDAQSKLTAAQVPDLSGTYSITSHTHNYAAVVHTHAIADTTGLQTALDGKANAVHAHAAADVTSGTFAIGRIPTGTSSTTVALGDHNHDSTYAVISHNHDSVYQSLNGKNVASGYAGLDASSKILIAQVPTGTTSTTVALGNHTHDYSAVYAPLAHNHDSSYVALSGDQTISGIKTFSGTAIFNSPPQVAVGTLAYHPVRRDDARLTDARTPLAHVHAATDVTSGTLDINRIPTGATGTTVALGNHTHAAPDLSGYQLTSQKNAANGYAGLDASSKLTFSQIPTGTTSTTVAIGNHNHDTSYAALTHAHAIADVTNLSSSLAAKSDTTHNHDSAYIPLSQKGAASGVATLDATGKVPTAQLPASSSSVVSATGTVPAGSTLTTITHNLNTTNIQVSIRDIATGTEIPVANETTGVNTLRLTFQTAPASNQYRYFIIGV